MIRLDNPPPLIGADMGHGGSYDGLRLRRHKGKVECNGVVAPFVERIECPKRVFVGEKIASDVAIAPHVREHGGGYLIEPGGGHLIRPELHRGEQHLMYRSSTSNSNHQHMAPMPHEASRYLPQLGNTKQFENVTPGHHIEVNPFVPGTPAVTPFYDAVRQHKHHGAHSTETAPTAFARAAGQVRAKVKKAATLAFLQKIAGVPPS